MHTNNRICYTMGGRMIEEYHISCTKSPPSLRLGGLFYPLFLRGRGLRPRLVASRSLVKPSAKVVADYPRRDGDKEGLKHILHLSCTPFPCRYGDGNASSIAYFAAKIHHTNQHKKSSKSIRKSTFFQKSGNHMPTVTSLYH